MSGGLMAAAGAGRRRRRRRRGKLMAKRLQISNATMPASSPQGTIVGTVLRKIAGTYLTLIDTVGNRFQLVGSVIQAGVTPAIAGKYTIELLEEQSSVGRQATFIEITVS